MRLSAPIFHLKRRARLLSRAKEIPLHTALNHIAKEEGFRSWSHLAACRSDVAPSTRNPGAPRSGDLVLLGARPGHGKTLLALELIVEATKGGRRGFILPRGYRSHSLKPTAVAGADPRTITSLTLDTSDDICADYVIRKLSAVRGNAVVVIDYLQLLDQRRRNPELADQIRTLKSFAGASGSIIVVISQIDRSFELRAKLVPEFSDVRLPNPLDLTLFTKSCFLHEGEIHFQAVV